MRVVLDSSVLVAASISRAGVCAELLEDVLTHHELAMSSFIAEELARKLRDKFHFPDGEVRELCRFLERMTTRVEPTELPAGVCRDPKDVPVLGTAVAAGASILVTVDKDLLALGEFQGIAVIKPGEFWQRTSG